ncbi:MAG: hypothetical protein RLY31_2042 [Bacteroidota bacterium]|jgi:hypothetical protein
MYFEPFRAACSLRHLTSGVNDIVVLVQQLLYFQSLVVIPQGAYKVANPVS